MKTKILLSFFAIAAIAFIGLARPAQSAASSAAVLSDSVAVMGDVQTTVQIEEPQEEQEKKQEKEKTKKIEKKETQEEKKEKKEFIWISKDGKTQKIAVFIGKDEEGKTIKIEGKPYVIIKKGDSDKKFIVNLDGKDIQVLKGEEGKWTVEADKMEVLKEGEDFKVIKLDKGNVFTLKLKKGEEGEDFVIVGKPHVQLEEGKPVEIKEIHLEKGKPIDVKEMHLEKGKLVDVHVIHAKPDAHTITIEGEEGEKKKIIVSPDIGVDVYPHVEFHPDIHVEVQHEKLKEKLKELQEKLKSIKEIENQAEKAAAQEKLMKELEKALEGLQKELEESKEIKAIKLGLATDLKETMKARFISGKELDESKKFKTLKLKLGTEIDEKIKAKLKDAKGIAWVSAEPIHIDLEKDMKIISVVVGDEVYTALIKSKLDSENKAKYEEMLKQLEKDLPEGYSAESTIDEEKNTITIKITFDKEGEAPEGKIKALIKKVVAKIKEIEGESAEKK